MSNILDQNLESYWSKRNPDSSDEKEIILKQSMDRKLIAQGAIMFSGQEKNPGPISH